MVCSRPGPVEIMPICAPVSFSMKARYSLARAGKLLVVGDSLGAGSPAGQIFVHALDLVVAAGLRGNLGGELAVDAVADADGNLRQFIEHVQLGHDQPGDAVDHHRVAQQRKIEPAAAAGTSGDRAVFIAAGAEVVHLGIVAFGGKWPFANARAVGLGHADHHPWRSGQRRCRSPRPPEVALDEVTNG